jgi:hypothetical protein
MMKRSLLFFLTLLSLSCSVALADVMTDSPAKWCEKVGGKDSQMSYTFKILEFNALSSKGAQSAHLNYVPIANIQTSNGYYYICKDDPMVYDMAKLAYLLNRTVDVCVIKQSSDRDTWLTGIVVHLN